MNVYLRDARPQLDQVPAALTGRVPERGAAVVDGPGHPRHVSLQRERHHAVQVLGEARQDPRRPGERPPRAREVADEGLDRGQTHEVLVRPLDLRQPREDLEAIV